MLYFLRHFYIVLIYSGLFISRGKWLNKSISWFFLASQNKKLNCFKIFLKSIFSANKNGKIILVTFIRNFIWYFLSFLTTTKVKNLRKNLCDKTTKENQKNWSEYSNGIGGNRLPTRNCDLTVEYVKRKLSIPQK